MSAFSSKRKQSKEFKISTKTQIKIEKKEMTQQQTAYLVPYFNLKYFEYEQQVGKSADLLSNLVIVDGFFYSAGDTNKFSLGFQYNPDRSEASTIALAKLGKTFKQHSALFLSH